MFIRPAASLTLMLALAPGAAARAYPLPGDANGDASLRARAARYEPMIAAAARRHGVDPRVLWTIAYLETRFRPTLVSPANAAGLMQFIPATARRFGLANRFDPAASIDAAARYVRFLSRQFDGRLDLILAGYNAGEGAVAAFRDGRSLRLPNGRVINPRAIRTGGVPPYRETRGYVRSGREVFLSLARARAFDLPYTDAPRTVPQVTGPELPAATLEETLARSTYFESETTFARAVALPEDSEIAADFVVTGVVTRERARTASIVFAEP
ncbi:MAG: lytic transglycosylase domain-containing protein [Planctomycetes bacterium]|nr:lytic transglycosylase domain-containing protein [Planctomycetota bacterium]